MSFPKQILFYSDGCVCEFKNEITEPKRIKGILTDVPTGSAVYKYLTGYYFKDKEITFSEKQISDMIRKNILTEIK